MTFGNAFRRGDSFPRHQITCHLTPCSACRPSATNVAQTSQETSLLRKLKTQTLPNEAPPMGKIHPFSKIAVTFEPVMRF